MFTVPHVAPESGWPVLDSSLSFTRAQFDSFLSVAVPGGILLGGLGLLAAIATALWRAHSRARWVVTKVVACMLCYGTVSWSLLEMSTKPPSKKLDTSDVFFNLYFAFSNK